MKAEYIIRQLFSELPKNTNLFSDELAMTSIIASLGTVTVTTLTPHGLVSGDYVTIEGIKIQNDIITLTSSNGIAYAETASDHDLTENWQENIEINGANEPEYNGMHELLSVPNRRNFTYKVDDLAPPIATGSPFLLETICKTFNGSFQITVTGLNTFTYQSLDSILNVTGIIQITSFLRVNHRISGSVNIERAIASYTKQAQDKLWLFVVLGDVDTDRDKAIKTDIAALSSNPSSSFRQRLILNFYCYVICPSTSTISGRYERDLMHDVFVAINKSLLLSVFDTGTAIGRTTGTTTAGHGFFNYANAYYIHEFRYQITQDIVYQANNINDTAEIQCTRAWRDIDLMRFNNDDILIQETLINLDDDPL